jgi:UDP-3-O-[3-hydroxymyristoyl] glucosamine N-acyltransferase
MKLAQIASALNGRLENGSPDTEITALPASKMRARDSSLSWPIPSMRRRAYHPASAVIVTEEFPAVSAALLRTKNPYLAFAHALELFSTPPRYAAGVHRRRWCTLRQRSAKGRTSGLMW